MRVVKYRAYDEENHEWVYSKPMPDMSFWKWVAYDRETPFYEWTGLKDKSGADIYEGDIVEITDNVKTSGVQQEDGQTLWNIIDQGLRFEVAWHTMRPSLELYPLPGSEEADMERVNLWIWDNDGGSECLRIIGNVHENPELLK